MILLNIVTNSYTVSGVWGIIRRKQLRVVDLGSGHTGVTGNEKSDELVRKDSEIMK